MKSFTTSQSDFLAMRPIENNNLFSMARDHCSFIAQSRAMVSKFLNCSLKGKRMRCQNVGKYLNKFCVRRRIEKGNDFCLCAIYRILFKS